MTIQKNSIPEAYNGPMVSLQNIHKTFNPHSVNELTIFENFNLDILKDQFISVIGMAFVGPAQSPDAPVRATRRRNGRLEP